MNKRLIRLIMLLPSLALAKVPETGLYFGGGIGAQNLNYYSSGSSIIGRLNVGYNFNEFVGLQAGANSYFGTTIKNQDGTSTVSGYGVDISAMPNLPLGEFSTVNLFSRFGVGYDALSSAHNGQSSIVDVLGLGVRYDISSSLAASLEYMGRGILTRTGEAKYDSNSIIASVNLYF